jgi:type II secretory pathway component GspD/PulD (secretin)
LFEFLLFPSAQASYTSDFWSLPMSLRTPLFALALLLLATCAHAQRRDAANPDSGGGPSFRAIQQPAQVKLENQLAKTPQVIEVDILIADWATGEEGEKSEVDLFGPTDQVVAKVQALEKAGKITVSRRIRMSTMAGLPAMVQLGERRPQVTGVATIAGGGFGGGRGGAGGTQTSLQMTNVGTLARITTQPYEDGKLVVELQLERSEVDRHQAGPVLSEGADGQKIRAEGVNTMQLQTTVALASGQTVIVSGTASDTVREIVLLSAKLVE